MSLMDNMIQGTPCDSFSDIESGAVDMTQMVASQKFNFKGPMTDTAFKAYFGGEWNIWSKTQPNADVQSVNVVDGVAVKSTAVLKGLSISIAYPQAGFAMPGRAIGEPLFAALADGVCAFTGAVDGDGSAATYLPATLNTKRTRDIADIFARNFRVQWMAGQLLLIDQMIYEVANYHYMISHGNGTSQVEAMKSIQILNNQLRDIGSLVRFQPQDAVINSDDEIVAVPAPVVNESTVSLSNTALFGNNGSLICDLPFPIAVGPSTPLQMAISPRTQDTVFYPLLEHYLKSPEFVSYGSEFGQNLTDCADSPENIGVAGAVEFFLSQLEITVQLHGCFVTPRCATAMIAKQAGYDLGATFLRAAYQGGKLPTGVSAPDGIF